MSYPAGTERVVAEVDRLLELARRRGASDLHLEPTQRGLEVRLRLDGVLVDVERLPAEFARPLIARLKLLADLQTWRSDVPQEGRLRAEDAPAGGDLRVSTFPTIHGERLVVRFFRGFPAGAGLDGLRLPPAAVDALRTTLASTSGVLLLTGPANSGKTTTLYAALNDLLKRARHRPHVITVEDPVESVIEGVTQTQINPAAGLTWPVALRSLLRQDPEVLMVGEVRDRETAEIVLHAGLTGHLVLSTFHGGSVAGVLSRLLDMRLEPYIITSALRAVLAMRLVRRLCSSCRQDAGRMEVALPGGRALPVRTFGADGCNVCAGVGYSGRVPVVEFATLGEEVKSCILQTCDSDALASTLHRENMRTLLERGCDLLDAGETSLDELCRVLGPIGTG